MAFFTGTAPRTSRESLTVSWYRATTGPTVFSRRIRLDMTRQRTDPAGAPLARPEIYTID
jgi:hypothetical protein